MNFFKRCTPAITSLFRTLRSSNQAFSTNKSPVFSYFKRSYFVDRDQIVHFRRRGPTRWTASPRTMVVVAVVGSFTVVTVYYGNLETVPYTKRSHVILMSNNVEKQLGEAQFKQLKESLKHNILPPIHPDSIRVRMISKQIIDSLQRGLHHGEKVWTDMSYGDVDFSSGGNRESTESGVWALSDEGSKRRGDFSWGSKDEILDDKWVHESRKDAKSVGSRSVPATGHLEGLNWEVLVVKDAMVNAVCMPGGKIIVFTGLLDNFRSDAEVATVIGHEVGHAVARHVAEGITKNLWLVLLQLILLQFLAMPDLVNAMSTILFKFPFSRSHWTPLEDILSLCGCPTKFPMGNHDYPPEFLRQSLGWSITTVRMEMEADYIGLLLMASAGYDPRVAPSVYQKLGQITGDSELNNYLSTHPSSKKRAELLSRAHVMEEAVNIYREALAGHGVEGFL